MAARSLTRAALASAWAATLALGACANLSPLGPLGPTDRSADAAGECGTATSPTDNTRLATIEQLASDGKHYAALAQLDALGLQTPQARLIRAEALRRIDRPREAQVLYESLLGSCLKGRALHGLGLLAAREGGSPQASLTYLQKARETLPTDPRIRNDLGYALLRAGELEAAQFEFLTVLDLAPKDPRASRNLVLLTFRQGQGSKAMALAERLGLDVATAIKLQEQARSLTPAASAPTQPDTHSQPPP